MGNVELSVLQQKEIVDIVQDASERSSLLLLHSRTLNALGDLSTLSYETLSPCPVLRRNVDELKVM